MKRVFRSSEVVYEREREREKEREREREKERERERKREREKEKKGLDMDKRPKEEDRTLTKLGAPAQSADGATSVCAEDIACLAWSIDIFIIPYTVYIKI